MPQLLRYAGVADSSMERTPAMVIDANNVSVYFASTLALDRLTFSVAAGEKIGFLGLNGAGKSTAMRILTGFLSPNSGRVWIMGRDPVYSETRQYFGYLPESNPLPRHMRVREYLEFRGRLRGLTRRKAREAAAEAADRCNIRDLYEPLIKTLSKGQRQRVGFAETILVKPPLLILDEPTSGLDPEEAANIRDFLKNLPGETTLFLSSHVLAEVESLCSRVIIIDRGRIIADGSVASICRTNIDQRVINIEILADEPIRETLRSIPGVKSIQITEADTDDGAARVKLTTPSGVDLRREISILCARRGWLITEMQLEPPSLEDVFRKLNRS